MRTTGLLKRSDVGIVTREITVPDFTATGELMRRNRKRINLSLRKMAARMDISAPYLSDLEHGRRNWTDQLIELWWKSATKSAALAFALAALIGCQTTDQERERPPVEYSTR